MPVLRSSEGGGRPEALFESCLGQIEGLVSWISRRFCMGPDDAEEFRSWVNLKLIEGDYRVLRSFSGRSGMATYLTSVIQNLARDYRMSRWGRWREPNSVRCRRWFPWPARVGRWRCLLRIRRGRQLGSSS